MNVCMVAYALYDIDRRIQNYAEALIEAGHSVDVLSIGEAGRPNKPYYSKGVHVRPIATRNYNESGIIGYLVPILKFFFKAFTLLSLRSLKHTYRVIHVHNVPDFLVFTCLVPRLLGTRLILDIHDILP